MQLKNWGYNLETHEILTEDGYILKIHRLVVPKDARKMPVLIMHGITACSANFLVNRRSLAYHLANKGYDVWVGNARGTAFSQKHKDKKNMSHLTKKFWDFSWHEMGVFDVPAMLSHIKKVTEMPKVHYVGFSMGTTMFLVMATTRDKSLNDVASVTLVAPTAKPQHFDTIDSAGNRMFYTWFSDLAQFLGRGDLLKYRRSIAIALYNACHSRGWKGRLCEKIFRAPSQGVDIFDFETTKERFIYYPCGSSVKSFKHFIQLAKAGRFQQFDYGEKVNKQKYGSRTPPEYDLGSISKEVYLIVGGEDNKADKRDVKWLHDKLPRAFYVSNKFEDFDHRDFDQSVRLEDVNKTVEEIIEAYEKEGAYPAIWLEILIKDR